MSIGCAADAERVRQQARDSGSARLLALDMPRMEISSPTVKFA